MTPAERQALRDTVLNWMKKNHHQLDDELGSSVTTTKAYNDAVDAFDALNVALSVTEAERDSYGDIAGRLLIRAEAAEAERDKARRALRDLVRLKDGPRDSAYYDKKPLAWAKARAAVASEVIRLAAEEGEKSDYHNLHLDGCHCEECLTDWKGV